MRQEAFTSTAFSSCIALLALLSSLGPMGCTGSAGSEGAAGQRNGAVTAGGTDAPGADIKLEDYRVVTKVIIDPTEYGGNASDLYSVFPKVERTRAVAGVAKKQAVAGLAPEDFPVPEEDGVWGIACIQGTPSGLRACTMKIIARKDEAPPLESEAGSLDEASTASTATLFRGKAAANIYDALSAKKGGDTRKAGGITCSKNVSGYECSFSGGESTTMNDLVDEHGAAEVAKLVGFFSAD